MNILKFQDWAGLNENDKTGLNIEQQEFLNRFVTGGGWKWNKSTGLVDIDGSLNCKDKGLDDLKGIKFGTVTGNFIIGYNNLKTLEGSPKNVGKSFNFQHNQIKTLKGGPEKVGGTYDCSYNQIKDLDGAPEEVGGNFYAVGNELKDISDAPIKIGGHFWVDELRVFKGNWNPEGVLGYLQSSNIVGVEILFTSPFVTPKFINKIIKDDPKIAIEMFKDIWETPAFQKIKDKLEWPKEYGDVDQLVKKLNRTRNLEELL